MPSRLNIARLKAALESLGISPAALSAKLDVSREAVSKWLNGESFPRPDKLLRLSVVTGLGFRDLVFRDEKDEPQVAFRKVRGTTTTPLHISHAREIGRALRALVPHLPFDKLVAPPVLKDPHTEYEYLQQVSLSVRRSLALTSTDAVTFTHLVRRFSELQAVLIPVLWGKKGHHENATHIYLPDSRTTWIYLNLDVQAHDFLFWMAHELGHCFSPDLQGENAEDFADAFAGALLFPRDLASRAYSQIAQKQPGRQINLLKAFAKQFCISPFCVYKEMNAFARYARLPEIQLPRGSIHGATTNFNKQFHLVSAALFDRKPMPADLINACKVHFESPFFDALGAYLRDAGKSPSFVQTVLDMSSIDAKGIHAELT